MSAKPASATTAASGGSVTLDVNLLGRDYKVACAEPERAELQAAVAFLDRRMREIRDQGKIAGAERVAVMAALNLAHELLRARHASPPAASESSSANAIDDSAARRRIVSMQSAIDQALAGFEKLS
jgi:cell division protein ZapA